MRIRASLVVDRGPLIERSLDRLGCYRERAGASGRWAIGQPLSAARQSISPERIEQQPGVGQIGCLPAFRDGAIELA
jgi:hypothetical protein